MPEKELKEALDKLTEELATIDQNDNESRDMLKALVEAIELKLNKPENKEHDHQLLDNLKQKALHFETKHPVIGSTLEEIIAILVRLDI